MPLLRRPQCAMDMKTALLVRRIVGNASLIEGLAVVVGVEKGIFKPVGGLESFGIYYRATPYLINNKTLAVFIDEGQTLIEKNRKILNNGSKTTEF